VDGERAAGNARMTPVVWNSACASIEVSTTTVACCDFGPVRGDGDVCARDSDDRRPLRLGCSSGMKRCGYAVCFFNVWQLIAQTAPAGY
jgi:hypothetical protein